MCGICGIVMSDQAAPIHGALLTGMMNEIEHRGPDAHGCLIQSGVALGHRRLSIVDVTAGDQPMTNEDGQVTVVFNGEIYNHRLLRQALESRGHHYRTHSDTEALVHLYEDVGEDLAEQLRGMFAFAIWDANLRKLTISRDHLGVKPLYYAVRADGSLVFGSEIKCIFASGWFTPSLDASVVEEYFATGHVSGERTLFTGIRKLLPGHTLTWAAGQHEIRQYWHVGLPPGHSLTDGSGDKAADMKRYAGEFWERFSASVQSQLMADVPLGVFLSGGLDSSLIVAAMKEAGVARIQSFSVGYAEAGDSELPWAREVANYLGTDHHETYVDADMFFGDLEQLTSVRDLPLTFSASIPLYRVAKLAGEHVKVVLTGEGSDELFAGYGRYPRAILNLRWAKRLDKLLPRSVRGSLAAVARSLGRGYVGSRIARSFLAAGGSIQESYLEAFADFSTPAREQLLGDELRHGQPFGDLDALVASDLLMKQPLEALLQYDQQTYLEELLMKQDAMSMATSIESRVPFLDHELAEWSASLPSHVKLHRSTGKALVRAAAVGRIPDSVIGGSKRGFTVPLAAWLRGAGNEALDRHMPVESDEVLHAGYVMALRREHNAGADHTAKLWRVLVFQAWRNSVLPRLASLSTRAQHLSDLH